VSSATTGRPTAGERQAGSRDSVLGLVDRVRHVLERPLTPYYLILGSSALLLLLGLVMVLSASSVESYATSGSSTAIAQKQAVWALMGVPLFLIASRLPVMFWRRLAIPALLVTIVMLVLVLVPGIGVSVNGNQNWIDLGGFRLQPAEAAKFALIIWGADVLTRKTRLLSQMRHLVVPLIPVATIVLALVLLGGDLGTSLILMAIVGGLLWLSGAPLRLFAALGAAASVVVLFMIFERSARLSRLETFLNPFADYQGAGWQPAHSMFALASGGWWGLGLGASREKWGSLPEAHTDFIFAIIGEELGLIGTITVLLLFTALLVGAVRIALTTPDTFVRLASGTVVVWIATQTIINVGGVVNVLPITGVPLPLVSYGGSALLSTLVALGMLLAFARNLPGARAALAARGPGRMARLLRRGR
jgi:cell division protein FtsW